MPTHTTSRLRRTLAGSAAAGLGVAGLTLLPGAPATASETTPLTLQWEISQQFDDHLSTHTLSGGVTEAEDGVLTFPAGEGTFDPETGAAEVAFAGSVQGAFSMAPGSYIYQVTFAEPVVTVDEEGNGEISAVVSAAVPSQSATADPARVVVTTFDAAAADWTQVTDVWSLADTPDWAGVLPEGEQSAALEIGAGKPVDGKAWAPTLLGHLPSGLRAHFYASGSGSDAKKQPAPFTVTADGVAAVAPAVEVTTSATTAGVEVAVSGTGFTAVTNPGDAGVYVGLAPSGGFPDFSDPQAGMDYFAASDWVMPAQMADGSFARTLTAPRLELDPRKRYSVYTWQAHTHSNPTQDTETPVAIDWKALGFPLASKVALEVVKKPTPRKIGKAVVTVTGAHVTPFGKVTVKFVKGRKSRTWTPRLVDGKATVRLPKAATGKWKLAGTYRANAVYGTGTKVITVRVTRR